MNKLDRVLDLVEQNQRKERLIIRLLKINRQKAKKLRKLKEEISLLQRERKSLNQTVHGLRGGVKSLRLIAQQGRKALEKIAYINEKQEELKADDFEGVALSFAKTITEAEDSAFQALGWEGPIKEPKKEPKYKFQPFKMFDH